MIEENTNSTNSWCETTIGKVLKLNYGKGLSENMRSKGNVPVYGSNGIVGFHSHPLINSEGIIVGRKGSVGLVHYSKIPFYPIDTTYYISPSDSELPLDYLYYLLLYKNLSNLKADVGVPGLNRNMAYFENIKYTKNKTEQRNISHILSTLQNAIEKHKQIINITQALKKSLLHQLFTQGTKGDKFKEVEIGLIPESWKMIKIKELGEIVTGTTPRTAVSEYYTPADFDFIAPYDIGKSCKVYDSQKKISRKGLSVCRELPSDSVLCVCIGSTIGKVGLTTKEKSATNQQINSIICDLTKANPLFVYYLLTFYNRLWAEAATPSPVPILSKGSFSKLEIPFTDDLNEQIKIAKTLYVLESKVEFQQKKKNMYESFFKTLLNELMSGQIPVHSIDLSSKSLI